MWLGDRANSQAALPAFVLGLVMSGHYVRHRQEQERMRVVAFAFLTPFFFLKGGMNVSAQRPVGEPRRARAALRREDGAEARRRLPARAALHRTARDVHDAADVHRPHVRHDHVALRPERRDHRPTQFSLLIAVVVLSAIVPTVIAQRFFQPAGREPDWEEIGAPSPALEGFSD